MKFSDYKLLQEDNLRDSIDDSDVLNILKKYSINNDRVKMDNGDLLYKFDNRYSMTYDGDVFTLYRRGDRIEYGNARNLKEIDETIEKWLSSYSLDSIEVNDDSVDSLIAKVTGDDDKSTDTGANTDDESDGKTDDVSNDDDETDNEDDENKK